MITRSSRIFRASQPRWTRPAVDFISLLPGKSGRMSDAAQAYTQARLKGKVTWVMLPEREWPE
eukprot:1116285-Alexandrium_andersonii.AAC.1